MRATGPLLNVFLTTLGCRLNEAEIATMAREFAEAGHAVVDQAADAHTIVVNTCAVTGEASRKSRKLIGRLHRQNPSARVAVTGCYAELEKTRVAEQTGVDLVVGNADKQRLVALVDDALSDPTMPKLAADADGSHVHSASRTRAFIKVQDGCRNRCAFCIVTIARGDERSRAVADIVDQVGGLVDAGHNEVVLTGVHLGGYGGDNGSSLAELVRALLADTDAPRLRLSSLEPWDLPDDFAELFDHPRLLPHLHLPLQSGSDSVLRRMSRRCPTADYRALVERCRERVPDLGLTTDLIVGFPGETDREWDDTVEFVRSIGFSHMHVFAFSPREGTKAARMAGPVSRDVMRARSQQMHEIAAAMKGEALSSHVGRTDEILWERAVATPVASGDVHGTYHGYTRNYLRAETTVPSAVRLDNMITHATIVGTGDTAVVAEVAASELARVETEPTRRPIALRVIS